MAAALLACMSFASSAVAQQADQTQEKIRLMVAAITYSENGDFAAAKNALEELLKIVPEDQRVQQLLAKANADLEASVEAKAAAPKSAPSASVKGGASEAAVADASVAEDVSVEVAMEEAVRKQALSIAAAQDLISQAYDAQDDGRYDDALALLAQAEAKLPQARSADKVRARIKDARADIAYERTNKALDTRNIPGAKKYADDFAANVDDISDGEKLKAKVDKFERNPYNHTLDNVSPQFVVRQKKIAALLDKGRIQYLYGDYRGAIGTYRSVQALDSDNIESKAYLSLIFEKLSKSGARTYEDTRGGLLDEVDGAWQRPQVFLRSVVDPNGPDLDDPVRTRLAQIIIPEVSFPEPGVSIIDALNTLSELSIIHDKSATGAKGVNIIARITEPKNISLTVRNLTLQQILGFVTKQGGFQYDIEDGAIIVSQARADVTSFETYNFPLSQAALVRIRGPRMSSDSGGGSGPFDMDGGASSGGSDDEDAQKIKAFLERAGVDFAPGASLAYDGSMVWVTNSLRNIEKVRRILQRYKDVLQVEIEAKFMEVNQGTLRELNFNWRISNANGNTLFATFNRNTATGDLYSNRNLATTFAPSKSSQPITISTAESFVTDPYSGSLIHIAPSKEKIDQVVPSLPSTINLATQAADTVSTVLGVINGYSVDFLVQALEQKTGSDLLSSPKVTVMNGVTATITVAQEMLYPTTWGDTQSNVGSSNSTSLTGGGAGVTITPGTPQDFTKRDVGVTMEVTPTVDESDSSITLDLSPRVTEFEGFMEYGGVALAISSGTTVTVPSGFVQPVFSVREVKTQVTVFDGATVVLGGLTREEVKTVNDRVPVLGDIPLLGRLFQSKGESREKKNLLIFVTANRITPGGSVASEQIGDVPPGSVFQAPTVISPSGTLQRSPDISDEE